MAFPVEPSHKTPTTLCKNCRWLAPLQLWYLHFSKFQFKILRNSRWNHGCLKWKGGNGRSGSRVRWHVAPRGNRRTSALHSVSGSPGQSAVRPRCHHRVRTPPEQIPLGARSNPCVATRPCPGRTPRRASRRRRPVRRGRRAPRLKLPRPSFEATPAQPLALARAYKRQLNPPRARTPPRRTAIAAVAVSTHLRLLPPPVKPSSTFTRA
jgi:hypothetical protein